MNCWSTTTRPCRGPKPCCEGRRFNAKAWPGWKSRSGTTIWRATREIAASLELPLQLGENFDGPKDLLRALQAGACDLVMPDVARIGGVSGWMQAAGVAEAHGVPMSSHLMPEVSAHLLAATPTCHLLEYVDWTDAIAREPVKIQDGCWPLDERPGTGLDWDPAKVARYRID